MPTSESNPRDLAIIGMSCRLPGAKNIDEYWSNLLHGVESICTFSPEKLRAARVPEALINDPDYVPAAPALDDVELFDAGFFGYSPKEAALIEPQQRLFMEVAWEAIESAGYCPDQNHQGDIGVYCGGGSVITSYMLAHASNPAMHGQTAGLEHISNDNDFMATRVSYKLNLSGPSLTVQTACSTSLVAVHLACQGILSGDCDMAIAGASAVRVPHDVGYLAVKGNVHSTDGHCRPFDADGTGTIFGSGVVAIMLKRLDRAIADRDHVFAVVKGSAINNDGNEKVSYTAPSAEGQARAVAQALRVADVDARSLQYVECHATGTVVGDPLEVAALTKAFHRTTNEVGFCGLGSVKSNIGHPEQAAGLAGLLKAALALDKEVIPRTVNLRTPNPRIEFEGSPFFPVLKQQEWPRGSEPRRAGVNSLGIGGTNAFVVLEEAPSAGTTQHPERLRLLGLGARSEQALVERGKALAAALEPSAPVADLVYTINKSRSQMAFRGAVVGTTAAEFQRGLESLDPISYSRSLRANTNGVVFMFSGQGAQYARMGKDLYASEPEFQRALDQIDGLFEPHLKASIRDLYFDDQDSDRIHETQYVQPGLFAFEVALARLWKTYGLEPSAVIGHSLGEISAAHVAGCLSLEDAVSMVAYRARLMHGAPRGGAMIAVMADVGQVAACLRGREDVSIAAMNAPKGSVISGVAESVRAVADQLMASDVRSVELKVSHAFHSHMMDPVLDNFADAISNIDQRAPTIPFISNLSGQPHAGAPSVQYWQDQIRRPVNFKDGLAHLVADGFARFLEIGPGTTLASLCAMNGLPRKDTVYTASIDPSLGELESILTAAGRLYESGEDIDLLRLNGVDGRTLTLPTYPFNRRRFWVGNDQAAPARATPEPRKETIAPEVPPPQEAPAAERKWQSHTRKIDASDYAAADHLIQGVPVMPTTGLIDQLAASSPVEWSALEIRDFAYHTPLVLASNQDTEVSIAFEDFEQGAKFQIQSLNDDRHHAFASGTVRVLSGLSQKFVEQPGVLNGEAIDSDALYTDLAHHGLRYGPRYQNVVSMRIADKLAVSELACETAQVSSYTMLDAALHGYIPLMRAEARPGHTWLPVGFKKCVLHRGDELPRYVALTFESAEQSTGRYVFAVTITSREGRVLAEIEGLEVRCVPINRLEQVVDRVTQSWLYAPTWRESPIPVSGTVCNKRWLLIGGLQVESLTASLRQAGIDASALEITDMSWPFAGLRETLADFLNHPEPAQIVHVVGTDYESPKRGKEIDRVCERIVGSALATVQAIGAADTQVSTNLTLLTQGAQPVARGVTAPFAAPLWGLAQTVALEYPKLATRCIDLDPDATSLEQALHIANELSHSGESHVGFRQGVRYVSQLEPLLTHPDTGEVTIQPDATYLITGGLSNLGLQMAEHLACVQGARSLLLTSRRSPDDSQRAAIERIERVGGCVRVIQAETAKKSGIAKVLDAAKELPPLRGIVHCSGVLVDGIIANQDWEAFVQSFAPKIRSSWLLYEMTKELDLDFFALQSSVLSVIGSTGQANYTAGNAFLDGLAQFGTAAGKSVGVMNWGPWSGGGMARSSGTQGEAIWRARGLGYIDPNIGTALFGNLLKRNLPQVVISDFRWEKFLAKDDSSFYSTMADRVGEVRPSDESAVANGSAVHETVESVDDEFVIEIHDNVADELGFDEQIDLDLPLNELGLDSLMSVNLTNRLEEAFGVSIPVADLIEGPSVRELAVNVAGLMGRPAPKLKVINVTTHLAEEASSGNPWLVYPKPNPNARMRLVCFPFAGGGSAVYRPWADFVSDDIELVAIEPPGRSGRVREPSIRVLDTYLKELREAVGTLDDKPIAFFGHCLGGLNMYETVRAMIANGTAQPLHAFASASRPPRYVNERGEFERQLYMNLLRTPGFDPWKPLHEQQDDVFAYVIRHFDIGATSDFLSHPQLAEILLPAIRADFEITAGYFPDQQSPWDIPITCFVGRDDPYVSREQSLAWSDCTRTEFRIIYRDAGHFIVDDDREFIVTTINVTLAECMASLC